MQVFYVIIYINFHINIIAICKYNAIMIMTTTKGYKIMNTKNLKTKAMIDIALTKMNIPDLAGAIGTDSQAIRYVLNKNHVKEFAYSVHMELIKLVRKILKEKEQEDELK